MDGLAGMLADDRPDLHRRVQTIPDLQRACLLYQRIDQSGADTALHNQAAGGGAALPGRPEGAPKDGLDRQVHVGIVHDDDRVLAAQFQADFLAQASRTGVH